MTMINSHATPAIFFDRDGVLNVDKGYVFRKEDFVWVEGAREAIALACAKGYSTFVITNQSGIARGFYTLDDMHRLHNWMTQEIMSFNARIDGFYFCPYHSDGRVIEYVVADHPDRKPNPGMILRAAQEHNIDLRSSLLIGDKLTDTAAADRAGLNSILFEGGNLFNTLSEWFNAQSGRNLN
jgi:D-glycero-D-manno-heptose 1,7-bisphosphate phosphatase